MTVMTRHSWGFTEWLQTKTARFVEDDNRSEENERIKMVAEVKIPTPDSNGP